jgi:hypothetical protein
MLTTDGESAAMLVTILPAGSTHPPVPGVKIQPLARKAQTGETGL